MVSKAESDSHTNTHKLTFGVYYRTGSPGQRGLRVAGFPSRWVADGSQNVTQFHVCCVQHDAHDAARRAGPSAMAGTCV